MLTLCMIVKNEEDLLGECLLKSKELVDEIIIVDTGSSDKTKDIALKFTSKVYDFKWCNDFSKARNFSIDKSTNDWVLVLDADEIVESYDKASILNFITKNENIIKVGRIQEISILENGVENSKSFERVSRLFNKKYNHYEGLIHEQILSNDGTINETQNVYISVIHKGYTKEVLEKTNKLKRNEALLEEAIEINKNDPYLYYQLGKTQYMIKNYDKSSLNFQKALEYDLNFNMEYVADLIETYGYSLINSENYSKALELEYFYPYYKENPDFNFILALIYMNNGKFSLAVQTFLKCTTLKNPKVNGVNSYLAYKNIGVIYEVLGFTDEANKYYRLSR